jgi:hypothetical protein
MKQLTLRVPDELARDLKATAVREGRSVNGFATLALTAAVDPNAAGDEVERMRERLARSGLLWTPSPAKVRRPDPERVRAARAAAGRGTPLSDLVSEGRGV